jgi:hypothetical protein
MHMYKTVAEHKGFTMHPQSSWTATKQSTVGPKECLGTHKTCTMSPKEFLGPHQYMSFQNAWSSWFCNNFLPACWALNLP